MQTDAVWAATWGENEKKAQCFYYAVISAVRREAPLRRELSTPWIPEGRDHASLMRFWNDMCQFKWTVFHSTERPKTKLGVSEDRVLPLSSPFLFTVSALLLNGSEIRWHFTPIQWAHQSSPTLCVQGKQLVKQRWARRCSLLSRGVGGEVGD